ncbi:MAG: adenylate/guanylate cyclase domain-containing protein [Oscillatoriales cyanobacterium RM2_1_1]|nr:adenylate/guanylate cyclase domain-containing protein [Oscillatoriales cyanobacterium SM2_3_0]NJO45011.1 adenylate/guanylate cyclase domain-containing protein [Oscillatoriales cyanobacterium RM2_1_1]
MQLHHTPYLKLLGKGSSQFLPLTSGKNYWTLGRSEDNNFVLKDQWASRNHAMLQRMEHGEFFLIDLGSRNGSFINGRRLTIPVILKDRDLILLGQTEFEFHSPVLTDIDPNPSGEDQDSESDFTATLTVRRLISVLVVDIRDFTVLTRRLDERILSEVIGRWFRHAGEIIRDHGSWVDKYIGDAIMAVWFHGTQGVSPQEMLRICQALHEMYRMTMELSDAYPLPFPLRVGAGLNTGYAMVGNTGSGGTADYTALGDTVNAAFRLESSTKQLGVDVALGEATYKYLSRLKPEKNFDQYRVNLKGYDIPTLTYTTTFESLKIFLEKTSE